MKKLVKTIGIFLLFLCMACSITACSKNTSNPTATTTAQVKTGKRVYFAGPLFNYGEKDFNLKITHILEEFGYQVFLPQRDGIEAAALEGKTEQELIEMIFSLDVEHVLEADIIFMNIDGRVPDEGACIELGIGFNAGKRCYGFKTDTRSVEKGMEINPMISGCMIKIFENMDGEKLMEELRDYLSKNAL